MANELHAHATSGKTLYAVLLSSTGQVWNGSEFEAYNGANWTSYDIVLTEAGAGIYLGTMPTVALGAYTYAVYEQAGASPATTDTLRGTGSILWDGDSEVIPVVTDASGYVKVSGTKNTLDVLADFDPAADTVSANVTQISGDSTAADRLEAVLDATPGGAVVDDNDPDPTATAFETNLSEATNDHYNGAFVVFASGALLGQSRRIMDYDGTSKVLSVAVAFTEAPAAGDTFVILGRSE